MSPSCGSGSVQGGHSHGSEFKCEICGKCFKHVRMLNRHRRNHSPYKKYKCAYCNKGFNDSFDLKRHVRTHTGLLSKKSPKNHKLSSKSYFIFSYFHSKTAIFTMKWPFLSDTVWHHANTSSFDESLSVFNMFFRSKTVQMSILWEIIHTTMQFGISSR